MKPLYVMLIGLPASGKTTLARQIVKTFYNDTWCVLSTDDFVELSAKRQGKTYDEVFPQAIDFAISTMNERLSYALDRRHNIIHDQTNLTVKSRARKLASIPRDYIPIAIVCETSSTERAERLASRPGKTIPREVDAEMVKNFQAPTVNEFNVIATDDNWQPILASFLPIHSY